MPLAGRMLPKLRLIKGERDRDGDVLIGSVFVIFRKRLTMIHPSAAREVSAVRFLCDDPVGNQLQTAYPTVQ